MLLENWTGDERSRYAAAKDLSGQKLAGLSFSSLRQALAGQSGTLIGRRLTRTVARQVIATLSRYGGTLTVKPTQPRSRPKLWMGAVAGGLVLVLVAVIAVSANRSGELPEPVVKRAATREQTIREPEATGEADEPVDKIREPLTTGQIFAAVKDAIATVTCREKLGTAFFVEPERALTNAHVACGLGEEVTVRLQDGREFPGKVSVWQSETDMAVIDVPGANADPITLGDSTALDVGESVVFIGNPQGLASTVHEAKVSYLHRNLHGVLYLQINGDVNPGNSGGPLLDLQAQAIGIISLRAARADRIGFALPAEYFEPYLDSYTLSDEVRARWSAALDRVRKEDQEEVLASRALFAEPTLISVDPFGPDRLAAIVLRRGTTSPGSEQLIVDISTSGLVLCTTEGKVSDWIKVEEALKKTRLQDPESRQLKWIVSRQIAKDLYLGTVVLEIDHCSERSTTAEAIMEVRQGGETREPVRFPKAKLERIRSNPRLYRRVPKWNERRSPGTAENRELRGIRLPGGGR